MSLVKRFPDSSLFDHLDNFFDFDEDHFFAPFFSEGHKMASIPLANITENDKEYVIKMDIPGVDKKDISVEIKDKQLVITGERKENTEEKDGSKVVRQESFYGKFQRSWQIDEEMINIDAVKAKYVDGVFTVELPKTKKEAKKVKNITVE